MKLLTLGVACSLALLSPANAKEYYNQKWFDYPDPTQAPKIENGCAHWLKTDSFSCHWLKCHHIEAKICTNPTHVKIVLLRKDVRFIVSGPDTADEAVQKAVEGYVLTCVGVATTAVAATVAGGVTAPGAPAAFLASFKTCLVAVPAAGLGGALLRQISFRLDSSQSHWSPL